MDVTNPIIPGFAPDPSVVKVHDWYFLVNSTFHIFPGLPIYTSRDLVSWKHIGNAINRTEQLSLSKSHTRLSPLPKINEVMLVTGGLYAPTIRFHEGTFFIVCTNVVHLDESTSDPDTRTENFIVTTKDIWSNEWSDPVYFDFRGIDPSLFFDGGRTYIQGSQGPGPFTKIQQFEIDCSTGEKLSAERTIWLGTGGIFPEGPHMYRRNGWYYLMISEGGTHENHMVTMARSKDVWGPYDPCPQNPILTARGTAEYIQYTGHCDVFQDENEEWWGVCLGVRKDDVGRFIMGRESFLTRGSWNGEWLSLDRVAPSLRGIGRQHGEFALASAECVDLVYIRDPDLSKYQILPGATAVTLTASPTDLSHPRVSPTFIGKRQRLLGGESTVTIHDGSAAWAPAQVRVGIACYKDEHRYVRIFYDAATSEVVFEIRNKAKEISRSQRHQVELQGSVTLHIKYTEQVYRLSYRVEQNVGEDFVRLAEVDTLEMTGPDFVGPIIGVFAVSDLEGPTIKCTELSIA